MKRLAVRASVTFTIAAILCTAALFWFGRASSRAKTYIGDHSS